MQYINGKVHHSLDEYIDVSSQVKDMFIWITGINLENLIIYDDETNTEHTSDSRSCVFNTSNWHCSRGHKKYIARSLRIDSGFNKDWAKVAGIDTYFSL
jgi:hypothetical protein